MASKFSLRPLAPFSFHYLKQTSHKTPISLRTLSTSSNPPKPTFFTNTSASFDWSDDEEQPTNHKITQTPKKPDPSNMPRPYDPFSKKPVIETPKDPSNLQEIFHNMRTQGLTNNAIKMFDALSKDGLTHEAMELFGVIKDKGTMPDVVAHTSVIEAYANAGGHSKEAVRTFEKMLACGVLPNVYTYSVLIKGLSKDGKLSEARKYVMEMLGKGMRVNVGTYCAVFEAFVREGKVGEGKKLLEEMKGKGFAADEKEVRDLIGKRRDVFRSVMSLLFG